MAELGGGGEQARRLGAVAQAGAAGDVEHRQREHGIAVAAVGREPVPLRGLGVVLRNAEPTGIKLAEQRHGARIALLVDALRRFREGGEEIAALIGAVGKVRLDAAARRRRRRRGGGLRGLGRRERIAGEGAAPAAARRLGGWRRGWIIRSLGVPRSGEDDGAPPSAAIAASGRAIDHVALSAISESRRRLGERRLEAARIVEHGVADGDEIGAGRHQRVNIVELGRIGDAGNLEHFGPPGNPVDDGVARRPVAGCIGLAEHDVVGAGLPAAWRRAGCGARRRPRCGSA